ncbi:MAG TPA: FIST N-terminal domain-containing protein [Candidatus Paceibacterota bacterium]|nr:FIST N-terminal domain-containing protein [Candidatus Paceibacterota bacterium]
MLRAGIGINYGDDAFLVGVNACQEAFLKLGADTHAAKLIIVFASVKYDQEEVLRGVRSVSGGVPLAGASTAGEITGAGSSKKNSVAVMVLASNTVNFFLSVAEGLKDHSREAGKQVADQVKADAEKLGEDLRFFMMFPDGRAGNGSEIVRGVLDSLGEHFPVAGGASGDDLHFEKTYQYCGEKVYSGAVVGIGFSGEFSFGVAVEHGWTPIGLPKKVTKSEGSVLYELDGKPAIRLYEDYFGEENARELKENVLAKNAIMYPLGVSMEGKAHLLIRDPLTVDADGAITCAAEVPEGAEVRLMVGSVEKAIEMAGVAAAAAKKNLDGKEPRVAFVWSGVARRKLFGERADEEIRTIQKELGADVPIIGFYTYGEQAPMNGEIKNQEQCNPEFHNGTVVICALGE